MRPYGQPSCFAVVAALSICSSPLPADDVPVATLRIASYEKLDQAAQYLQKLGKSNFKLEMKNSAADDLYGIASFDSTRPTTFVLMFLDQAGEQPIPSSVQIAPVTRVGQKTQVSISFNLKDGFKSRPKAKQLDDKTYRWDSSDQKQKFVRVAGDVALIGTSLEAIAAVQQQLAELSPSDGTPDLVEVRILWRNAPPAWKRTYQAIADGWSAQPESGNRLLGAALSRLVADCESLTASLDVSPDERRAAWKIRVAAVPDSPTEQSFSLFSRRPTRFAHLLAADAALNVALSLRLPPTFTALIQQNFDPLKNEGVEKFLKDNPEYEKAFGQEYKDFTADVNGVYRSLLTLGRLDTAWRVQNQKNQQNILGGFYAPGAENLNKPTARLFEKMSPSDPPGSANLPIIDGIKAHRFTDQILIGYGEDAAYLSLGQESQAVWSPAWNRAASRNSDSTPAAVLPAVYVEGDGSYVLRLGRSQKGKLPAVVASWLETAAVKGRYRLTIDRGDHDVTMSFMMDEPLLQTCVGPQIQRFSQLATGALWHYAKEAFSPARQTEPAPADAAEPLNAVEKSR